MTDARRPDDPDAVPDPAPDPAPEAVPDAVPDDEADSGTDAGPPEPVRDASGEPPPVPAPPSPPETTQPDDNAKMWASFCHLAGLVALIQVPGVVGSLLVWLLKRDEHPFIDEHGKEALNFQINVLLLHLIGVVAVLCTFGAAAIVAVPVFLLIAIVPPILATIAASDGKHYRYPFILRFVS